LEERPGLVTERSLLELSPLDTVDTDALVSEIAGAEVVHETRARIASTAEGNPLFVEQLLAFLDETGPEGLESLPPTIDALLASRLDRLDAEERTILQRAAVAGREFRRAAVVHLTPPDEVVGADRRLQSLVRRGLIHAVRA